MKTKLRSPLLNSKLAIETLRHHARPEFEQVIKSIELSSSLFDNLSTLHGTPNPEMTRESHALKYKGHFIKAQELVMKEATKAASALDELEGQVRLEAEAKAGLHTVIPESTLAEIRTALRGMTQKERDNAIKLAAKNGDVVTIQAVKRSPSPILTGATTAPIDVYVEQLIDRAAPELKDQLEAIQHADNYLTMSVDAFISDSTNMRELDLEVKAVQQIEVTSKAEAELSKALERH